MKNPKIINKHILKNTIPYEIDQDVKSIKLKHIEKLSLKRAYDILSELELELSSDDESLNKKYLKEIEFNANLKKMDPNIYTKSKNSSSINTKLNSFKETINHTKENDVFIIKNNKVLSVPDTYNDNSKIQEIKLSKKSLRKILRKLNANNEKVETVEDIDLMLWEVDEDMDGRVSKYEFENMYKRCINDLDELEPKRLFYLIQFLMYDKDQKFFITEEDTLELLYIRYGEGFNTAIEEIFQIINDDGKKVIKAKIFYDEFLQRMQNQALKKRIEVKDKRKNYCKYIEDNNKNK